MTRAEERKIYAQALATHGITAQTLMLAEECSELVKAASKCCRYFSNLQPGDPVPPHLIENLVEEMADVEIMVGQMKMEYYITDSQVEDMKEAKLCRLKQRLGLYEEKAFEILEANNEHQDRRIRQTEVLF